MCSDPQREKPPPPIPIRRCAKCGRRICDAYLEGASIVRIQCKRCGTVNELKAA